MTEAAQVTELVLAELGLARGAALALREVSTEHLIAAQMQAATKLQREVFLPFAPVTDPATLPVAPAQAIAQGIAKDVPLLTGTTLDEWRLFTFAAQHHRELGEDALRKRIALRLKALGHGDADELIGIYRQARPEAPSWQIFDAIETDRHFRIPAIHLAESQRVHQAHTYMYLFTWPSPAIGGLLGSCHALELQFVFGTLDAPHMASFSGSGPKAEALSQVVMDTWLRFVSGDAERDDGLAHWPSYDADHRSTTILDAEPRLARDPAAAERRAWDGIL